MLVPSEKARAKEAPLLFGSIGSGKSDGWASIADVYRKTGTPGHFHILETVHEASDVIAEGYPDFDENCTIYEATDWDSLVAISQKANEAATPNDWIICETIGNAQVWSRDDWFKANRGGLTMKEFQAEGHSMKEIKPDGWLQMDSIHREWLNTYILGFPGHRLATAGADQVRTEQGFADNKAIRDMFGLLGIKAIGHKDLGYVFRSILYMSHPGNKEWTISTVDDPKRPHLEDAPAEARFDVEHGILLPPFVASWLIPCAGWRLT